MHRQHLEVSAGENRTLTLSARDSANAVKNLTGATLSWRVGKGPYWYDTSVSQITKTGTIASAGAGTFTVSVGPSDTQHLEGDWVHFCLATISGNVSAVVGGRFRIKPQIET